MKYAVIGFFVVGIIVLGRLIINQFKEILNEMDFSGAGNLDVGEMRGSTTEDSPVRPDTGTAAS